MLTLQKLHEVVQLLAGGELSEREVARRTGVGRATVGRIACSRRRPHESPLEPSGPPERCPGCGDMVYMPCRRCLVQNAKAASRRSGDKHPLKEPFEPLGLELNDKQRARYEAIRARKALATDDPLSDQPVEVLPPGLRDAPCDLSPGMLLDALEIDPAPAIHELQEENHDLQCE